MTILNNECVGFLLPMLIILISLIVALAGTICDYIYAEKNISGTDFDDILRIYGYSAFFIQIITLFSVDEIVSICSDTNFAERTQTEQFIAPVFVAFVAIFAIVLCTQIARKLLRGIRGRNTFIDNLHIWKAKGKNTKNQ